IWFYDCCLDNTVVIRVANGTPRIFNWKTSNKIIFFEDLKNIIFKTYGNQMNAIDQNNLHESCSHHETENQATLERNDDDAHQHVEETEKVGMNQPLVSMREYVDISNTDVEAQNPIEQTVDGVSNADIPGSSTSKPPSLDDYLDLTMTQIVQLDLILNVTITPDVQPRNRNHGKYDTSPYIRLSKGESSVRGGSIFSHIKYPFESHNEFQVADDLIDEFRK
ncbi:hypothetical protein H5410_002473, partial [Solanum commersonii]